MRQWSSRAGKSLAFMSRDAGRVLRRAPSARFRVTRFSKSSRPTTTWRVFGVHLSAVHAAWTERRRLFELRALLRAVRRTSEGAARAHWRLQHRGARATSST